MIFKHSTIPVLNSKTRTKTAVCKTKTKADFLSQTGLVLRPTVSDHITGYKGKKLRAYSYPDF